jgi:hypothetical protein
MGTRTVTCEVCEQPMGNPACPACRTPRASPPVADRRRRPRPLPGGSRPNDPPPSPTEPPLTTRDCADWMGVTTEYIRGAIVDGQLEAEIVTVNGRRMIRVHVDQFREYLQRIGWKRIPARRGID